MAVFPISEGDDAAERMAAMFGPAQIDQQVRQAIQFCWMGLPKKRRPGEEVETQIRRIVERALRDSCEDREAFGKSNEATPGRSCNTSRAARNVRSNRLERILNWGATRGRDERA